MLNEIRVASPCSADWDQMPGDERVRHCSACNLNVYNLSALTEQEIRQLITDREGRLCARMYRRRDGSVLTQDCPVGLKAVVRRLSRLAGAVLSVMMPVFFAAPVAEAQSYTKTNVGEAAVLVVDVVDPEGGKVAHAQVTLTELGGSAQIQGKTDRKGRLVLRRSLGGRYALEVLSPSFRTFRQTVQLRGGETLSLPVRLNDGGALMGDVMMIEPGSKPK